MLPRRLLALALCLAGAFAAGALAQPAPKHDAIPITGEANPNLASFDDLLTKLLTENKQVPGAALAVTRHGKLVYARGFGHADTAKKIEVQPNARFRIASITKPLTAVAILQLVERGKLKLSDRVFHVLKLEEPGTDFDPRWKQITIHHLLLHRGGFDRDRSGDPMFMSPAIVKQVGGPAPAKPDQIIRFMLTRKLDFDPGSKEVYSNFGYCMLGQVVGRLGGSTYEDYVKAHVLKPLGVTDMAVGHTLTTAAHEVHYYAPGTGTAIMGPRLGKPVPWPYGGWCLESMDAHGGWIATAADLVRFASAFDTPARCKVLEPGSIRTMFSPDPSDKGKAAFYACGWMVRPIGETGRANTWHAGSLDGTSSLLVRRFDGLCWAVLFNTREKVGGQEPASWIDGPLHGAADAVKKWP